MKPEFWSDEKLGPLSPLTRLVFLGLVSLADDAGRLLDNLKTIDAFIFPYTDDSAALAVQELTTLGRIERGVTASGQRVIQLVNWKHQKIEKPNFRAALPAIADASPKLPRPVADESPKHISISINDQLPTTDKSEAAHAAAQDEPPMARVMVALRRFAYQPDGTPPAGWSDRQDGSIAAQMLKRGTPVGELVDAIEGCRLAVDDGAFQDWTPPVKPGDKFTLRLLYHTKSGPLPTWTVAMLALDARWKANGARKPSGPVRLGSALGGAVTGLRRGAA